jgi:hypothetical protein
VRPSPLPRMSVREFPPAECGKVELEALFALLHRMKPRPSSVVIGSSADAVSRDNASRIAAAWAEQGGLLLTTVTWPETAASWLRHARRFAAPEPDAWIVTATPAGWVGMGRRLAFSTTWSPQRTVATAGLADPVLIEAGGLDTFDGLRGAYSDGRTWEIVRTLVVDHERPEALR